MYMPNYLLTTAVSFFTSSHSHYCFPSFSLIKHTTFYNFSVSTTNANNCVGCAPCSHYGVIIITLSSFYIRNNKQCFYFDMLCC